MGDFAWTLVGVLAALLTSFGFLPQVIKMWRRRSAGDVSLATFLQFALGVCLWIAYGTYRVDPVLVAANVVTLAILLTGLSLFHRYAPKPPRQRRGQTLKI